MMMMWCGVVSCHGELVQRRGSAGRSDLRGKEPSRRNQVSETASVQPLSHPASPLDHLAAAPAGPTHKAATS